MEVKPTFLILNHIEPISDNGERGSQLARGSKCGTDLFSALLSGNNADCRRSGWLLFAENRSTGFLQPDREFLSQIPVHFCKMECDDKNVRYFLVEGFLYCNTWTKDDKLV
ncbi:hypothetical protein CEXT_167671 [Caerostris extrusa]|uniref:Uncharacterized protein n=1 Tax=Caerostris extrusa TaxID=172846 RepID=A0AAV4Y6M4_CAEEX|nr:hypothetical protein CEXT_167671 [Caerostris extrusa]